MRNVLLIAVREFTYNLRRPSFLFAVFGTPVIIAVALVLGLSSGNVSDNDLSEYSPVGYVDNSPEGVLAQGITLPEYPDLFVRYETTDAADAAARAGEIVAYLELPPTYMADGRATLYTMTPEPDNLYDVIDDFLRANLSVNVPDRLAVDLLADSPELDVTVQDGNRRFDENGAFFVTFLPIIFGFLLITASVTTSSFLMSGLVEEKTNRIMEVLITSVRPIELLTGKIIGMGALGLLQVFMLLAAGVIGISIAEQNNIISGLTIPVDLAVLAVIYYLLAYFLMAAIGIAIGAIVGSEQESRQLSALFVMPVMIPYVLLVTFLIDPNGTLPTALSLIPFTSPMAILMRSGMTTVPLWQIGISVAGLILTNLLVLWISSKLFRWGVLSTNKTPGIGRIIQVLRGKTPELAPQPKQPEAV